MELNKRMKKYEKSTRQTMTYRMPYIIRIDGRSFHSIKGMNEPFDRELNDAMAKSARAVCKDVAGAKLAYVQSDEASILVTTYDSLEFEPHFGNRVQKLVSTTASTFTRTFNNFFNVGTFDSRVFTLPKEEVCNYFIWRQQDWERNSIRMLGQFYFSKKELHGLSNDEVQEKLWQEKDINWGEDLENWKKNGTIVYKQPTMKQIGTYEGAKEVETEEWTIWRDTPVFTKDREFINQYVYLKEGKNE